MSQVVVSTFHGDTYSGFVFNVVHGAQAAGIANAF